MLEKIGQKFEPSRLRMPVHRLIFWPGSFCKEKSTALRPSHLIHRLSRRVFSTFFQNTRYETRFGFFFRQKIPEQVVSKLKLVTTFVELAFTKKLYHQVLYWYSYVFDVNQVGKLFGCFYSTFEKSFTFNTVLKRNETL